MKLSIAKNELEFDQKPTLNKDFWQDEKLNPEVKDAIMAVVESFLKSTNLEIGVDDIDEIEFTGSLANYNYSKFSDVDIHLLFDFSKLSKDPDFMRELFTAKAIIWNDKNNVTLFGHEVELYITDAGTDHHSTGVYSVKNDEWLVKPVRDPKLSAELNLNKVKDKADKISKEIDMLVIKDDLSLEKIKKLKDKIKKMRIAGLETGGEFSTENLAFKLLRRRGELNTLYTLMQQARDEELSLDEDIEWWKKRRSLDNKNYRELMGHVGGKGVFKRKYAAKNIGYPKSVSRKKLGKLGAPYMMDPQMKLPKSAPPGIMEQKVQNVLGSGPTDPRTINNVIRTIFTDRNPDDQIKITFRDFYDSSTGTSVPCLKSHSYSAKTSDGDNYEVSVDGGDYKKYFHPQALKIGFDPTVCLFNERPVFDLTYTRFTNWIGSELRKGNISEISFIPGDGITQPVTFKGSTVSAPRAATLDPSERAAIAKALKQSLGTQQSNMLTRLRDYFGAQSRSSRAISLYMTLFSNISKSYQLTLVPKEDVWFLTDIKDLFEVVKAEEDFADKIEKLVEKIGFIYYKPGMKYHANLNYDNSTVSSRSVPGDEIKNEIIDAIADKIYEFRSLIGLDVADGILSKAPGFLSKIPGADKISKGVAKLGKDAIKKTVKTAIDKITFSNLTETFTKKEYLQNLLDSTDGKLCKSFDCSKSTIRIKGEKPVSIEKFAKAALRRAGATLPRAIDKGVKFEPKAVGDVVTVNIDGKRGIRLPNGEIRLGGSLAWLNNNPGNLKLKKAWRNFGAIGRVIFSPKKGSGYHAVFLTYEDGYNALVRYLKIYMGNRTFRQFAENIWKPTNPIGWATRAAQAAGAPNIDQKMKNYDVDKIINGIKRSEGYNARKSTREVIK